jgi:predicted Fe-Mo cluster-binding NifX family protein
MKVAVTATVQSLDGLVDPQFGRCPCVLLVDTEARTHEWIENPSAQLGGGAGIRSAELVSRAGAEVVLTGRCGPNAEQTLRAAGIRVVVGCTGTVLEAVERFKSGLTE